MLFRSLSLSEANHNLELIKLETQKLNEELDSKKKEVENSKRELKFIENQMANAGERMDQKSVVAAASSVVSSLNSKILSMQKEMEIIKTTLQRERVEHSQVKEQLDQMLKTKKIS